MGFVLLGSFKSDNNETSPDGQRTFFTWPRWSPTNMEASCFCVIMNTKIIRDFFWSDIKIPSNVPAIAMCLEISRVWRSLVHSHLCLDHSHPIEILQLFLLQFIMSITEYVLYILSLVKRLSSYFNLVPNEKNLEDAFYQLLFDRNYDEALKLALQHRNLDVDLVHKCKWRHSGITIQSIDNILAKVQDKLWVINECVKTVPMSYEACRRLLEFGLREANVRLLYELGANTSYNNSDPKIGGQIKVEQRTGREERRPLLSKHEDMDDDDILELIDFSQLNSQQKDLCRFRQYLIHYEHSLSAYENTLGDYRAIQQNFNHVFYDEFRQKSPLNFCIDFANEGDVNAVEICLDFYLPDLGRHLLAILSNFPETMSPYKYRNLLPCVRKNERVFEWRSSSGCRTIQDKSDWSMRDRTISSDLQWEERKKSFVQEFYHNNQQLKKFMAPFTSELLTEWYKERALDMESRTSLTSPAIQLLYLGAELNVKGLKQLHDDLIEFDRIVHDFCPDEFIYISYQEFKKLPETCCQFDVKQKIHDCETKYKSAALALALCDDPDGKVSLKILDNIIELRKRDEKIQLNYLMRNM